MNKAIIVIFSLDEKVMKHAVSNDHQKTIVSCYLLQLIKYDLWFP